MTDPRFVLNLKIKDAVLEPQNRTIMVMGGSDTGKTTLIEDLLELFLPAFRVGVVDADLGQSHVGPPTTIAWTLLEKKFEGWENLVVKDFYFVGATSPSGNLLPMITGVKIIHDKARPQVDKILVDTTGMIRGEAARVLKRCIIEIIQPQIILALQRTDELEHILVGFKGMTIPRIYRMKVPPDVRQKDYSERVSYREQRFKTYFKNVQSLVLACDRIGLGGIVSDLYLHNRLICLRDREGKNLALGIVAHVDGRMRSISVYTPLDKEKEIGGILWGKLRINLEGKEVD
jgi:polynucleotide 5'-hydroxyl-kinase GRC3/NOL9